MIVDVTWLLTIPNYVYPVVISWLIINLKIVSCCCEVTAVYMLHTQEPFYKQHGILTIMGYFSTVI